MKFEEAKDHVSTEFPFQNYIGEQVDLYKIVARTVQKYLNKGDSILDFGSGPCDLTAVIATLGYKCSAYDDLLDNWHKLDNNKEKILKFASNFDIDFKLASDSYLPFNEQSFELVMLHHVLEHLHDSPRDLLNDLVNLIKPNGYLFITVPNAANIRKRISIVLGKTNLPPFDEFYWYPGPWRGHIREYVKNDLIKLAEYLGLKIVDLRSCHCMLYSLPPIIRPFHIILSKFFPGWRDSWLLVAKKPEDWSFRKEPHNGIL